MTTIKVEDAKDVVMDEPEEEVEEAVTIHTTEEKEVILFKRIVGTRKRKLQKFYGGQR